MSRSAGLQRAATWLAIVGYALVASGLPLPVGLLAPRGDAADASLAGKDRSQPFPCMDNPCGCATAEQCFARCCCHTPAERLAWAKAHAVAPAVLAALERRVAADTEPAQPTGGCCAASAGREATCSSGGGCAETEAATDEADVRVDVQSLAAEPAVDPDSDPDADPAKPRLRTVTLRAMLACGGIVTEWLAVGASLPPPRVDLAIDPPLVAMCVCGDSTAAGIAAAPTPPPPRGT